MVQLIKIAKIHNPLFNYPLKICIIYRHFLIQLIKIAKIYRHFLVQLIKKFNYPPKNLHLNYKSLPPNFPLDQPINMKNYHHFFVKKQKQKIWFGIATDSLSLTVDISSFPAGAPVQKFREWRRRDKQNGKDVTLEEKDEHKYLNEEKIWIGWIV